MTAPTLIEILNKTAEHFKQKGIENNLLDAQLLIGHVLKLDRVELYLNYDRPLTPRELDNCREVVRRRASREPLQHILSKTWFRKLQLKIDRRALIPRKETELIIDIIKQTLISLKPYADKVKKNSILDVGVGSGAIFLSLKKELPEVLVEGVEMSKEAIELARENAAINKLDLGNSLFLGNRFEPFPRERKWDIIVSNPPYIAKHDFSSLEPEVRLWDPPKALIGGENGTEFSALLIKQAYRHTLSTGFLILEIGEGQAKILKKQALKHLWKEVMCKRDFSGVERFLILKK
jgi:release factor glutamine methyltransferase